MTINSKSGHLYISDKSNGRIEVFDLAGKYLKSYSAPFLSTASLNLSLDNAGNLIFSQFSDEGFIKILSPELDQVASFGVTPDLERPLKNKLFES